MNRVHDWPSSFRCSLDDFIIHCSLFSLALSTNLLTYPQMYILLGQASSQPRLQECFGGEGERIVIKEIFGTIYRTLNIAVTGQRPHIFGHW